MAHSGESIGQRAPGVLLGAGAIAVCLLLRAFGVLVGPELAVHDRFLRQQAGALEGLSPVVGISIGEREFARYGFPIPDSVLARTIEQLARSGVRAIGVDLYRPTPASDRPEDLAGWRELGRVVSGDPRVVMSELLPSADDLGTPAPAFADPVSQVGFNDLLVDRGRVVRRGYMIDWDDAGEARLSLSLRLALLYLRDHGLGMSADPATPDWVRLGDTTIRPLESDFGAFARLDAGGYQFLLDYARSPAAIETMSLESVAEGQFDASRLRGRVALLGTDSPSVKDDFNAPHSPGRVVKGYRLHAHIIDQLIRIATAADAPTQDWRDGLETTWIVAWGLSAIVLSLSLGALAWAVPALALGLGLLYLVTASLFASGVWVPTVAPAMAWVCAGGLALGDRARREARAQRQVMGLFRRFASRKVADALWRQRDDFMEGGRPKPQRLTISALLSDLKGYTEAAEKLEPSALMAWIDSYMDAMTRVIEAHGGHVDDYVGDGIKANFGVPIPSVTAEEIAADARRAVRCALEMGRTLERLNGEWARKGWPSGRQRIGIYTGAAVVGTIGSEERLKYTTVGDTINTAARLEAIGGVLDFDKEESLQRVLIGEPTRHAIGEAFELETLGAHAVKGKTEPLEIYRILGERSPGAQGPKEEEAR